MSAAISTHLVTRKECQAVTNGCALLCVIYSMISVAGEEAQMG